MPLTPVDIQNKQFRKKLFGGYDPDDVDSFLDQVIQEMERLIREQHRAQETIARLEQQLQEYRELKETLTQTLVTAQETAENVKAAAKKEAELIIQEARLQAERLVEAGQAKAQRIMAENAELQRQAEVLRSQLKGLLTAQLELLDRYLPQGPAPLAQAAAARQEGVPGPDSGAGPSDQGP